MKIDLATSDSDIEACYPVMAQLRPHVPQADWLSRVRRMEKDGFRLAALQEDGVVRAVAGFRVFENLFAGRVLYVDDLVTAQDTRSHGHGKAMLDWLSERARTEKCATLELDSGTQRVDAHRFYLRERMNIICFHFARKMT
jgi:GNAT superfamily N-acetyltransferase